jgi:type IV pilus assembly protein PilQ
VKNNYYSIISAGTAALLYLGQPSFAADSSIESEPEANHLEKPELIANLGETAEKLPLALTNKEINLNLLADPAEVTTPEPSLSNLEKIPPELAQATPNNGVMVPQPEILIRSNGTAQPDILQPTLPASPILPRAVAPPVGDMAISNINTSADQIDLGTRAIVPRLVLRQAPAREVLAVLARYAGLNVVFLDGAGAEAGQPIQTTPGGPPISLDLQNEPVQEVFNSVLMVSGLQANRRGKTIFVGAALPQTARNLISRTLRLNQVKSFNAATFLATQGAEYQRLVTKTEDIVDPLTQRVIGRREIPAQLEAIQVSQQQGSTAPLLLTGLRVAADDRLNSITLIGEPQQVQVATSLITQLDARRRQVVVNVKVVDVNLVNTQQFNSSFSFGFDDGFFLQDQGTAILNFGGINPPNQAQTTGGAFAQPIIPLLDAIVSGGSDVELGNFLDVQLQAPFGNISRYPQGRGNFGSQGIVVPYSRPNFGTYNNPFQPGLSDFTPGSSTPIYSPAGTIIGTQTTPDTYTYEPPGLFQYPRKFLSTLQAQIVSGNAKILTDPSVIVQEGQKATVKLTQKVIESVDTQVDPLSGVRTTTPVLADAGLTLTVDLDKVDDNGFINLSVSPTVAAPGSTEEFNSGAGAVNTLTLLNRRELTSGLIRLRDGQTLILSGIIAETERSTVKKVPILGDIPLLGALFRSNENRADRTEVIILLTPKIMNDTPNTPFGFQYTPGPEAADVLRRQGFPVQTLP